MRQPLILALMFMPMVAFASEPDPWAGTAVGRKDFDQAVDYLQVYHLDKQVPHRALPDAVQAAWRVLVPQLELVPTQFFAEQRKQSAAGEKPGTLEAFACGGKPLIGVAIHHRPVPLQSKPGKTDGTVAGWLKVARDHDGRRDEVWLRAWEAVTFGRAEFACAMDYALGKANDQQLQEAAAGGDAAPPDQSHAWLAATQAYMRAFDRQSRVVTLAEWDDRPDNAGEAGIGAGVVTWHGVAIACVAPGSPAWRAGVRSGDAIVRVDNHDVLGEPMAGRLSGKASSIVNLAVARDWSQQPIQVRVERAVPQPNVHAEWLPGSFAYLRIVQFLPNTIAAVKAELQQLAKARSNPGPVGIVLDLRGNTGGLLNRAIDTADLFLGNVDVATVRSRKKGDELHKAHASPDDIDLPMVVLVDSGTSSGGELLAAALRAHKRGLLVGARTFGNGFIHTLFEAALSSGYYIKVGVGQLLTPAGESWHLAGLHPDVEVADSPPRVGLHESDLADVPPKPPLSASPWQAELPGLVACAKLSQATKGLPADDPVLARGVALLDCLVPAKAVVP